LMPALLKCAGRVIGGAAGAGEVQVKAAGVRPADVAWLALGWLALADADAAKAASPRVAAQAAAAATRPVLEIFIVLPFSVRLRHEG